MQVRPATETLWVVSYGGKTIPRWWTAAILKIVISPYLSTSSLVPSVLHLSYGFQCSPSLNRQPYEGKLPLTSWWTKSSNMTVGQSSLISLNPPLLQLTSGKLQWLDLQPVDIKTRWRHIWCRVLSLSDRRYSLNPLSQTRIDLVGRYRIRLTFKLSCVWH